MNRHSTMNSAGLRWGSPAAIPNWCFLAWTNIESQMEKPSRSRFGVTMSRPHGECCKARAWNLRWSQKQKREERQQYSKAKNGNQSCQDRGESGEISGEDEQGHARRRGGRTSGRALFQKCGTWSWRRALLGLTCFPTITELVDAKARIMLKSRSDLESAALQSLLTAAIAATVRRREKAHPKSFSRLAHEKAGSGEYNHKAGVPKDARQLLAEKRKQKSI
jgi:hypothetical protein